MAAESLENKAKEMGITLKAETNGSGGAKNVLTKEEIENCDGIIVAADKNVEMARFDGKQVLQTKAVSYTHLIFWIRYRRMNSGKKHLFWKWM